MSVCEGIYGDIYTFNTTNRSFVKHAEKLKNEGIEHWYYPLLILNPEAIGIDPHNSKLTDREKAIIVREAMCNPFYFYREVVRNDDNLPYALRDDTFAFIYLYCFIKEKVDLWWMPGRQRGKTLTLKASEDLNEPNSPSLYILGHSLERKCFSWNTFEHLGAAGEYLCAMWHRPTPQDLVIPTRADYANACGRGQTAERLIFLLPEQRKYSNLVISNVLSNRDHADDRILIVTGHPYEPHESQYLSIFEDLNKMGWRVWNNRLLDEDPATLGKIKIENFTPPYTTSKKRKL